MFRNYLKTSLRNLWRHRTYSLINIAGLSVALTVFMLIFMYVKFELSYDNFHQKGKRIYRLETGEQGLDGARRSAMSDDLMGQALKTEIAGVEDYVLIQSNSIVVKVRDKVFREKNSLIANPAFFQVFSFPIVAGSIARFNQPYTIILSETTARKYFGDDNPVGKTVQVEGDTPFNVIAVAKDVPANSQFKFDAMYSFGTVKAWYPEGKDSWTSFSNLSDYTFLLLREGVGAEEIEHTFPAFLQRHLGAQMRAEGTHYTLSLSPLEKIYLENIGGLEQGNERNIYIFSSIAGLILLIAAINFINLATARSIERAKEVGVRKVVGALRRQVVGQFLAENTLVAGLCFILSSCFISLLIPVFNSVTSKTIAKTVFQDGTIFWLFGISALVSLLAGLYPALALSSFQPIQALKGRLRSSVRGILLRKTLVIFQFSIAVILIVATLVISRQLKYMQSQPLGFDKSHLLTVYTGWDYNLQNHFLSDKDKFKSIPNVEGVTMSTNIPGSENGNSDAEIQNAYGQFQKMHAGGFGVDQDFISVCGIKLIAGHNFPRARASFKDGMIINEAAAKALGYSNPATIIGKPVGRNFETTIIGVVKDFHYTSLADPIRPLLITPDTGSLGRITFKIAAQNVPQTIAAIEKTWKTILPGRPFDYNFVDEEFNKQYTSDEQFGKLFLYFAAFAIFISCLGLFGLASYTIQQQTREIGIRKILGATAAGITGMISKQFLQLVLIASVVSFPVAWFGMRAWLDGFSTRIELSWWFFGISGLLALVTAFATIAFQATKAALANPLNSIRTE